VIDGVDGSGGSEEEEERWQQELHELWLQGQKKKQQQQSGGQNATTTAQASNQTTTTTDQGQTDASGKTNNTETDAEADAETEAEENAEEAGVTLLLWFYHGAERSAGQRSVVTYVPPHSPLHAPAAAPTPTPPRTATQSSADAAAAAEAAAGGPPLGKMPSLHLRSDARNASRTLLAANLWTSKGRNVAMITGPLRTAVPSYEWAHLAVVVRKRLAQIYVRYHRFHVDLT
jgi:hypothetical protein